MTDYLVINGVPRQDLIILMTPKLDLPDFKSNMITVPGASGKVDLSTVLSGGNPLYDNVSLVFPIAVFETDFSATKTRLGREFHGRVIRLSMSDDEERYLEGRCTLSGFEQASNKVVTFTLTLDAQPFWLSATEQTATFKASSSGTEVTVTNSGQRWVAPKITVSGGDVELVSGNTHYQILDGTTKVISGIILRDGDNGFTIIGGPVASVAFTWTEGTL